MSIDDISNEKVLVTEDNNMAILEGWVEPIISGAKLLIDAATMD